MSFRRAFRIAGAQAVLASHWKASDKATSRLMTEFIRCWHSGEPIGVSPKHTVVCLNCVRTHPRHYEAGRWPAAE